MSDPTRLWMQAAARYWSDRRSVAGTVIFGVLLLACLAGPFWLPDTPDAAHAAEAPAMGSPHPLGTDTLGHDVLARGLAGGRVTLLVAIAAGLVSVAFGFAIGALAGFPGRPAQRWLPGLGLVIATILLAAVLVAWLGPARLRLFLAAGILGWGYTATVVRSRASALRESAFLDAARLSSLPPWLAVRRHVLPNLAGTVLLSGLLAACIALVMEALLTAAGLGGPPFVTTWGAQVGENLDGRAPWALAVPVVLLMIAVGAIEAMRRGLAGALALRR